MSTSSPAPVPSSTSLHRPAVNKSPQPVELRHQDHRHDKYGHFKAEEFQGCLHVFESIEEQKATSQSALSAKMLHAMLLSEERRGGGRATRELGASVISTGSSVSSAPGSSGVVGQDLTCTRRFSMNEEQSAQQGAGARASGASTGSAVSINSLRNTSSGAARLSATAAGGPGTRTPSMNSPVTTPRGCAELELSALRHIRSADSQELAGRTSSSAGSTTTSSRDEPHFANSFTHSVFYFSQDAKKKKGGRAGGRGPEHRDRHEDVVDAAGRAGAPSAAGAGSAPSGATSSIATTPTSPAAARKCRRLKAALADWEESLPDFPVFKQMPMEEGEQWGMDTLLSMIKHFQTLPEQPLHPFLISRMLHDVERLMVTKYADPIFRCRVPNAADYTEANQRAGHINVVGDTHGQLEDVLWIFYKNGLPSPSNAYLFNGDIADRGFYATEIFMLVFGFMLLFPDNVHVNRGNHEDETMNLDPHSGGFYGELVAKYGNVIGPHLYEGFLKTYARMPLATVLEKRIFIVHGGLSRVTDCTFKILDSSANMNAMRGSAIPDSPQTSAETVFLDAMWSDPTDAAGIVPSHRGPQLVQFGPDITHKFLRQSGMQLVIRSHELPHNRDGVEFHHENRLITIFSASNYCGIHANQGAVLVVRKKGGLVSGEPKLDVARHFSPTFAALKKVDIIGASAASTTAAAGAADGAATTLESPRIIQVATSAPGELKNELERDALKIANERAVDRLVFEVKTRFARILVENKQSLWRYWLNKEKAASLQRQSHGHRTSTSSQRGPGHRDRPSLKMPPGLISFDAWRQGILSVVGVMTSKRIPWESIKELLEVEDPHSHFIDYALTLQRFRVVIKDELEFAPGGILTTDNPGNNQLDFRSLSTNQNLLTRAARKLFGTKSKDTTTRTDGEQSNASSEVLAGAPAGTTKQSETPTAAAKAANAVCARTEDDQGRVMLHSNWMEFLLAQIFDQLLQGNIPLTELLSKFAREHDTKNSTTPHPKDINLAVDEEIDFRVFQKVLLSLSRNRRDAVLTAEQAACLMRTLTGYGQSRRSQQGLQAAAGAGPQQAPGAPAGLAHQTSQTMSVLDFLSRLEICYTGCNVQLVRERAEHKVKEGAAVDEEHQVTNLKFGTSTVATCLRFIGREISEEIAKERAARAAAGAGEKGAQQQGAPKRRSLSTLVSRKMFELFQAADADKDGLLDEEEFTKVTEQLLQPYASYLSEYYYKSRESSFLRARYSSGSASTRGSSGGTIRSSGDHHADAAKEKAAVRRMKTTAEEMKKEVSGLAPASAAQLQMASSGSNAGGAGADVGVKISPNTSTPPAGPKKPPKNFRPPLRTAGMTSRSTLPLGSSSSTDFGATFPSSGGSDAGPPSGGATTFELRGEGDEGASPNQQPDQIPRWLLSALFHAVDMNGQGTVSYLEFLHCFMPEDASSGRTTTTSSTSCAGSGPAAAPPDHAAGDNQNGVAPSALAGTSTAPNAKAASSPFQVNASAAAGDFRIALIEQICGVLYSNKQALLRLFQFYDQKKNHRITRVNFIKCLKCLNVAINLREPPLTTEQIQMVADHCVLETDEELDYVLFLNALCICDMHTGEMFD